MAAKDCIQTKRKHYEESELRLGRTRLTQLLEQSEGVAGVTLHQSELSRNKDGELMDKYYVALSDSSVSTPLIKRVEQHLSVFETSIKGNHVEFVISHASYLHAQDTLAARLRRRTGSLFEACLCCILIFVLLTRFIL